MKKSTTVIIVCVIIVLLIALFAFLHWSSSPLSTTSTADTSQTETGLPTIAPSLLALGDNNTVGSYLTATSNGMTLYTFKNDSLGTTTCTDTCTTTCTDTCTTTWPPYTVASPDNIGADADIPGAVGTIVRPDGTYQVTYNGMPLYFYSQDVNKGNINGNNVGGLWAVALP